MPLNKDLVFKVVKSKLETTQHFDEELLKSVVTKIASSVDYIKAVAYAEKTYNEIISERCQSHGTFVPNFTRNW